MKTSSFYLFITVFFTVYLFVNFYLFISLRRGLLLSRSLSLYLALAFVVLASLYPLSLLIKRMDLLIYPASIWLGIISICFSVFLLKDLISLFLPSYKFYITSISIFIVLSLSLYSLLNERRLVVREIMLPVRSELKGLAGTTFVQLSDLHLDHIKDPVWLNRVVEKVNALDPDFVLITGDLVDVGAVLDKEKAEGLKKIKTRYGVYACLGNHEYYSDVKKAREFISQGNVHLLVNQGLELKDKINIVGVDSIQGPRFGAEGPDLKKGLSGLNKEAYTILLTHEPDNYKVAYDAGIDLMLSGHTHAGQIPPLDILVFLIYKHGYGLYPNGKGFAYTSSGTGSWGPPMRFLNASEIVKFTLIAN